jgi:membrane protease YdiL (CAAX protease family)
MVENNNLPVFTPQDFHPSFILLGLIILGILFFSIVGWIVIAVAKSMGRPLPIADEAQQPPPWGLVDVLLGFFAWIAAQIIAVRMLGLTRADGDSLSLGTMASIQVFVAVAILMVGAWLVFNFGRRSNWCGWSFAKLPYDVFLAVIVFCLSAPLMWFIMFVASLAGGVEYNHPLIEAINANPASIFAALWVAVVAAPLIEEFLFRVLLQGYLQSMADSQQRHPLAWFLGRGRLPTSNERVLTSEAESINRQSIETDLTSIDPSNPYAIVTKSEPTDLSNHDQSQQNIAATPASQLRWWPISISGVIFGLMHFEYGVSWIPLIFFGWVLGWLYQRTNRIWPSMIAHMVSNSIAVTAIAIQALYGPKP